MRRGTLATTINGVPCTVEYTYGDPLPATDIDPYEPPEIELVRVLDVEGRAASWLERKMGNDEWQRIREDIEERERP